MSISNRAAKLTKAHRVLKKHYKSVTPTARPILEHLLYACCLENAAHEAADEAFAKLQEAYFDWNEVRVTTVSELSETLSCLPDPADAAKRLKRTLQAVFETYYAFDLEFFAKENIGQAVKKIQSLDGVSAYAVSFVTQHGLGGHAIAVNAGALAALEITGIITPSEAQESRVPGLERAIAKAKGLEFASLLHQLGVDFADAKQAPRLRRILVEIEPEAKDRLPKRGRRGDGEQEQESADSTAAATDTDVAEPVPKKKSTRTSDQAKKRGTGKKKTDKKDDSSKKTVKPSVAKSSKKSSTSRLSKKKPR